MSGSSLSDSCYSVSSEAAQCGAPPPARPSKLWDQMPLAADNADILWPEIVVQQPAALLSSQEDGKTTEETAEPGELVQKPDTPMKKNTLRRYCDLREF